MRRRKREKRKKKGKRMKKGESICIKREKIYGESKYRYQRGTIEDIYSNHILVRFEYENGNSFRESFFKNEVLGIGEVKDDSIF